VEEFTAIIEALQKATTASTQPQGTHVELLDDVDRRVGTLKRKLDELDAVEVAELRRCTARLAHLQEIGLPRKDALLEWNRRRLNRLLVDHLLRRGYLASALHLARDSSIQELVDAHIFVEAQKVLDALRAHDCGPALAWCGQHAGKLRKIRSHSLEFKLRLQEFVELVRQQDGAGAISYAREHLSQWAEPFEKEMQRAFAVLVFTADTQCSRYQALFDPGRWRDLQELFQQDLYRLHSLTSTSLLNIHLQAGLAALKVPQSLEEGTNKEDPLHLADFRALAAGLPFSKHVHSKLVCAITRAPMNEHNPPMVTPAGAVYSEAGINEVAAQHGGVFVDPFTGAKYEMAEMRRAYIS
jgi:macrophage erythroblast attacher